MSLRKKTLLIVSSTLITSLILLYFVSQTFLLNSFLELEEQGVNQDIERIHLALYNQHEVLNSLVSDWAFWDDTYNFVVDVNQSYIESNLTDGVFANLGLNFIVFINSAGEIVFSKGYDLLQQQEIEVSPVLINHLEQNPYLLNYSQPQSRTVGLINLPEGIWLVAAQPILTSHYEGPAHGTLIMGRLVDDSQIDNLAETARRSLAVYPVDSLQLPPDVQLARANLSKENPVFIQPLTAETIAGYTLLEDIYDQPALILKTESPRQIYQQGRVTLTFFMLMLLAGGLAFSVLVLWLLERGVLSRLTHLSQSVGDITRWGDSSARISLPGRDELSNVIERINEMLTALQHSEEALRRAQHELEDRVNERTAELQASNMMLIQQIHKRDQAELALQNSNQQLATMYEIGQLITAQLQLEAILPTLASHTAKLLETDTGVILLLDETSQTLTIKGAYGLSELIVKNTRDRMGEGIAGRVALTGQPMIVNNLLDDPRFYNLAVSGEELLACASVPLKVGDKVIGTLGAHSKTNPQAFNQEHIHLLQLLADQAAIAIQNARLYAAAQQEIAERKKIQEVLAQARDRALEASRLKTELLAKVSHELRTPLGVILGFAEMLDAEVYGPISEQQHQVALEILFSTQYLNNLVNELLDQAQLEAGKLILKPTLFTPTDLLEETILQLRVLTQGKELTLTSSVAPDMPATLYSDRARVQQILINLLSNAIKFTSTGLIEVYLYQPDSAHWAIQVSDTGMGIPPEAQLYIFDPFRQVDGSPTRQHGGTGLGLSIVKQLTALMGGQVNLQSKVGQGSVFTVRLPLAPLADKVE